MAGYGSQKFNPAAELTVDEVVRLWANYQNKNSYAISRDGTALRDGTAMYARAGSGGERGVRQWVHIAEIDRISGIAWVNAEARGETWSGPVRQFIVRELNRLCGDNAIIRIPSELDGEMVGEYTLPREVSPEYTTAEIEQITGVSYSKGGALRVTRANGKTTSFHIVESVEDVILRDDMQEESSLINILFKARMEESRYDKVNDILPPPYLEYKHPDDTWSRLPYRHEDPLLNVDPDWNEETCDQEDDEEDDDNDGQ